jgi:hypothetical protein
MKFRPVTLPIESGIVPEILLFDMSNLINPPPSSHTTPVHGAEHFVATVEQLHPANPREPTLVDAIKSHKNALSSLTSRRRLAILG